MSEELEPIWNCTLKNVTISYLSVTLSIYSGLLIFMGTMGNMLIVLGMCRDGRNRTVSRNLLILLSIADTSVLWTAVVRYGIDVTLHYDIRELSWFICKTHSFFTMVTTDLALAILCVLSVERLISMRFPLRSKTITTQARINLVLILVVSIILAKQLPIFWIVDLDIIDGDLACTYVRELCDENTCPHFWIEFATHIILPYFILIPTNVCLYLTLRKSVRRFQTQSHRHIRENCPRGNGIVASKILICLSVVHLLLSFPGLIYVELLGQFRIRFFSAKCEELLYDVFMLLTGTNNALNFYAIILLSSRFRSDLAQLCGVQSRQRHHNSAATSCKSMALHRTKISTSSINLDEVRLRRTTVC